MTRVARGLARLRGATPPGPPPGGGGVLTQLVVLGDLAARQLFEADGGARLVIDRTGTVLRASDGVRRLLGRAPNLATPMVDLLTPDQRAAVWQAIEQAMARGVAPDTATAATGLCGDGTSLAVDLAIAPVGEADGRISGAVVRLTNAAQQRKTESELVNSRKLQAVGALAGGIAHDFNNLLQAVSGAAEALGERPGLDAEAREDVALILAAARRGSALVRQLLAFARQQTLLPQTVAVNPAISDLAGLLRRTLGESVRFELALEQPGRLVRVDPGQLDQVIVNLAVNARDAMPSGGVLTLRTGHRTLLDPLLGGLEPIPPGRYVTIEVVDCGTGIPPEVLPRIFEPFFTTRPASGTGLGMSTVLGIVRQSGGFLQVETQLGVGTTMRILLPRIAASRPIVAHAAVAQPTADPPRRANPAADLPVVLLVEDEDPVRHLAARALARQGWHVIAAASGEAALDLVGASTPLTVVVSDMVMPGMDGATLIATLRARLGAPHLPALIVSGYAEARLQDAIGATSTAYLAKPYSMRDLTRRVDELIDGSAGMREGAPMPPGAA